MENYFEDSHETSSPLDQHELGFSCLDYPIEHFEQAHANTSYMPPAKEDNLRIGVNAVLGGFMTDKGVEQWWSRERHQLEGKSPSQVWSESPDAVIALARDGRSQSGS